MAVLKAFRAPQPKALYPGPGAVSRDGALHGWSFSFNPGNFAGFYGFNQFGANPFVDPTRAGLVTAGRPARFGRRRGWIIGYIPPVPPP